MDSFSSVTESQQGPQNHDQENQQNPARPTQAACYHHPQRQSQQHHHAYNPPPGYAFHQVPLQLGTNPVAVTVVALSQLSQCVETATALVQANLGTASLHNAPTLLPPPPAGGSPYNSVGRGGRRSFRGNGGRFNCRCLPRTGDHGTGPEEGRGGPQCFQQHGASSVSQQEPSIENVTSTNEAEASAFLPKEMAQTAVQEPSIDNVKSTNEAEAMAFLPEEMAQTAVPPVASQSTASKGKGPSRRRPPQSSLCELCRVECNSLEMLEDHKNGKRHQRKLQKTEESKSAVKPGIVKQDGEKPAAKPENQGSQQPIRAPKRKEKKSIENQLTESVDGKICLETNEQISREKHTEAIVEEAPTIGCVDTLRCEMKSKMQAQKGKCMDTSEAPKLKVGPCKLKVVIPLICDLCNVKCDTQKVFDCHLSEKNTLLNLNNLGLWDFKFFAPLTSLDNLFCFHEAINNNLLISQKVPIVRLRCHHRFTKRH